VAPLRLEGLRGKQSTPSNWLGGTGEVSTVGEWEQHGACGRQLRQATRQWYVIFIRRIEGISKLCLICMWIVNGRFMS